MAEVQFDLKGRKLMLAVPAFDGNLNIRAAFGLMQLPLAALQHGFDVQFAQVTGYSLVTKARNALVKTFLDSDCTDLLFLDSDVVATTESVVRILALGGDKDIVAGNYPRKSKEPGFYWDIHLDANNEVCRDEHGLIQADRVATGFMLIRRHVLEQMQTKHPEWSYKLAEGGRETAFFDVGIHGDLYYGEDYLFCKRAIADGFKIWCDPEISLVHVGTKDYDANFKEVVFEPVMRNYERLKFRVVNG